MRNNKKYFKAERINESNSDKSTSEKRKILELKAHKSHCN